MGFANVQKVIVGACLQAISFYSKLHRLQAGSYGEVSRPQIENKGSSRISGIKIGRRRFPILMRQRSGAE
jgi:hypothetical protein